MTDLGQPPEPSEVANDHTPTPAEVAFQKTADQYELTEEERQDPRIANLVRGTVAFSLWAVTETMRRFTDALKDST
jgi:hypothetical protein